MSPAKKRRVQAQAAADSLSLAAQDQNSPPTSMDLDEQPQNDLLSKLHNLHTETMSTLQTNLKQLVAQPKQQNSEHLLQISLSFTTLKLLQRQIALLLEDHSNSSKGERTKVESRSLTLQNLQYEKNYLSREIEELKAWKAGELEQMAMDELQLDGDAGEEAIDAYLFQGSNADTTNKSYRQPSNHEFIITKLNQDKETRSSLVEQLSKSKSELKEMQQKRDQLHNFQVQIRSKLKDMEKMGESLSTFFRECNPDWLGDADVTMSTEEKLEAANTLVCSPSMKRSERFTLAQSLPSPLYALFVQLLGYVDAWSMVDRLDEGERDDFLGGFVGADGMNVVAVPDAADDSAGGGKEKDGNTWNVELNISAVGILPPEITTLLGKTSKGGGDDIKIVFSYDAFQGVVLAQVAKTSDNMNDQDLLDNLFPGDDGSISPNLPSILLMSNEKEVDCEESNDNANLGGEQHVNQADNINNHAGKPYHWCQVLGGLNFPPPSSRECTGAPFQVPICTKAVLRQLLRRIRARRSLSAILDYLSRRAQNLPIHPAFRREDSISSSQPKAKIVSWVEEKDNHNVSYSPSMKRYVALIKRKSSTLKAAVMVDMQNYPAEPPIWSLTSEDGLTTGNAASQENGSQESSGTPPLFDATLHRIETHVNTDLNQFVTQNVESTYDWILMHQLVAIVSCWDEMLSASEGNTGGRGGGGKVKDFDYRRVRKGKERRLVGFGEQNPFFYFRHGL